MWFWTGIFEYSGSELAVRIVESSANVARILSKYICEMNGI